jgi:hypothetical protein
VTEKFTIKANWYEGELVQKRSKVYAKILGNMKQARQHANLLLSGGTGIFKWTEIRPAWISGIDQCFLTS